MLSVRNVLIDVNVLFYIYILVESILFFSIFNKEFITAVRAENILTVIKFDI